jgi:hypothetical protein
MASLAEKHQLFLRAIACQLYASIPVCTSVIDTIIIPYLDMDEDAAAMKRLLLVHIDARRYLQYHTDSPKQSYVDAAYAAINNISDMVKRRAAEHGLVFRNHYTDAVTAYDSDPDLSDDDIIWN